MNTERRGVSTYVVLFFSICFIVTGIYRNEVHSVFKKAINICLECIGIG